MHSDDTLCINASLAPAMAPEYSIIMHMKEHIRSYKHKAQKGAGKKTSNTCWLLLT